MNTSILYEYSESDCNLHVWSGTVSILIVEYVAGTSNFRYGRYIKEILITGNKAGTYPPSYLAWIMYMFIRKLVPGQLLFALE